MDYQIRVREDRDVLYVCLEGRWDQGTQLPIVTALGEHVRTRSSLSVLMDVRDLEVTSTLGRDYYVSKVLDESWGRLRGRVAVLESVVREDDCPYFTAILRRAGLNAECFCDPEAAARWLGDSSKLREENGS